MKIAYCFAGHLRTFRKNRTLLRNLLAPNPGDVFVYTFSKLNGGPRWHKDHCGDDARITQSDLQWIESRYKPLKMVVDPSSCGADYMPVGAHFMGFRHAWARVHSLYDPTAYDVVMNVRFDLVLPELFGFPHRINSDTLYGGLNFNQVRNGRDGEVFTLGTPEVMQAVWMPAIPRALLAEIPSYGKVGEALVTRIRQMAGLRYEALPVKHGLLRSNGETLWVPQS